MAGQVQPVPHGYHTVTPYLVADHAEKVIAFLQRAFDARLDQQPTRRPDGSIMHAAIRIGDSMVMIANSCEQAKAMPAMIYLYLPDVDAAYRRALDAGATSIMEPSDQFYGDRSGGVTDASGNQWFMATHVEDVTPDEIERRAAEAQQRQKQTA